MVSAGLAVCYTPGMKSVFIYGPPAAGKLTVANELSRLTGLGVFLNHEVIALLSPLFPYDSIGLSAVRKRVSRDVRLKIFGEAIAAKVDFITTFGMSGPQYFDFFREINQTFEKAGRSILFVQLTASKQALISRVSSASRLGQKIDSPEYLEKLLTDRPEVFSKFPDIDHPTIDNSSMAPDEVALMIYNLLK